MANIFEPLSILFLTFIFVVLPFYGRDIVSADPESKLTLILLYLLLFKQDFLPSLKYYTPTRYGFGRLIVCLLFFERIERDSILRLFRSSWRSQYSYRRFCRLRFHAILDLLLTTQLACSSLLIVSRVQNDEVNAGQRQNLVHVSLSEAKSAESPAHLCDIVAYSIPLVYCGVIYFIRSTYTDANFASLMAYLVGLVCVALVIRLRIRNYCALFSKLYFFSNAHEIAGDSNLDELPSPFTYGTYFLITLSLALISSFYLGLAFNDKKLRLSFWFFSFTCQLLLYRYSVS